MNTKGKRVALGQALQGAILARDVYKDRDMLLLAKDHVLTEALIEKLRLNGVEHIYIKENHSD